MRQLCCATLLRCKLQSWHATRSQFCCHVRQFCCTTMQKVEIKSTFLQPAMQENCLPDHAGNNRCNSLRNKIASCGMALNPINCTLHLNKTPNVHEFRNVLLKLKRKIPSAYFEAQNLCCKNAKLQYSKMQNVRFGTLNVAVLEIVKCGF